MAVDNIGADETKKTTGSEMKVSRIIKAMRLYIEKLVTENFTGVVVFRMIFNQGGVRETKITIEKNLEQPPGV